MDVDAILMQARSGEVPSSWTVWQLRRDIVLRSAFGWAAAGVLGLIILAVVATQTIPDNFTHGAGGIVLTGLLLAVLAIMGFGGVSIAIYDFWRVAHASEFLLVMTPDDYIKAEPRQITHVPMEHVTYVTLRGIKMPHAQDNPSITQMESRAVTGMERGGRIGGGMGWLGYRRQPKQAPSLAFLDSRTDQEIVVGTDNSFDELPVLEQVLTLHAGQRNRTRTG